VYNNHPYEPKKVAMFTGCCCLGVIYAKKFKMGLQTSGRYGQVVAIRSSGLTLFLLC